MLAAPHVQLFAQTALPLLSQPNPFEIERSQNCERDVELGLYVAISLMNTVFMFEIRPTSKSTCRPARRTRTISHTEHGAC
jgi:hypothetical protein